MQSDTPHFARIAQRAPLILVRRFLEQIDPDFAPTIDWQQADKALRKHLKQAAHDLPDERRRHLDEVAERIDRMTDEAGVEAIRYLRDEIVAPEMFEQQLDQYGRSLWLYLEEPANFQRAEDTRYADEYRGSPRIYAAFEGPVGVTVTAKEQDALLTSLAELFPNHSPMLFDHFVRPRHDIEAGEEIELHQFSIDHNDDQQSVETIAEDGDRTLVYFCPLNSIKITYEPSNGVVEIYSRQRNLHPDIFRRFARHILQREIDPVAIPKRCYDLSSLSEPRPFPVTDPDIASVRVSQLRLKAGTRRSSITLKLGAGETRTIWQLAWEVFGHLSPLAQAYEINQATLVIGFHKRPQQRRSKALTIVISLPNGCNIKSHCDKDRQLAEKYLKAWHLLQADAAPGDA
ncbi:hypothetical protein EWI61_04820 [Methylolobus aquaticus]|nr:hypothetical protein EWI61_04820 [Methylolobus aquaticus]